MRAIRYVARLTAMLVPCVLATGCRSAGCIRIEARDGSHVTIHATGPVTASQGKTVPIDVARQAAVSGIPGATP